MKTATELARKIADQELEACCEAISQVWEMDHVSTERDVLREVRAIRRPKPPSMKEQALIVLDDLGTIDATHYNILRNALGQLDDN